MSLNVYLSLCVVLPLIGAAAILLCHSKPNLRETVTLITAFILFCLVLGLEGFNDLHQAQPPIFEIVPGLPIAFRLEPLGQLFALVASGLWIVTSIYAIGYMRGNRESNQTRFYFFFAISISAAMGIALAENLFTLFIFYEVLTLSTYPLVTHKGNEDAKRGGRTYLTLLLSTSIGFFLIAIIWTWSLTGDLSFVKGGLLAGKIEGLPLIILLMFYLLGIGKAALMPFHRWLPAAMVAPTPVSALLHAVAVVKAGVFTVLKVSVYVFGIDFLSDSGANLPLMWLAAISLLLASITALRKTNLKARLAYSTVSQLAYVTLGAMLASSMGVIGGGFQIATHALAKITLFFCAGAIYVATHKTEVEQLDGLGRVMPFTFAAFFIASLSIIGIPPLVGSWSKWYLLLGTAQTEQWLMMIVLMVSSLLSIAYLIPIPLRGFFAGADHHRFRWQNIQEAPWACVIPLCMTALACLWLFFYGEIVYELILPVTHTP